MFGVKPMDSVFQYRLPVWHPLLVHFPVALLLLAAVVAVVWVLHDRTTWRTMLLVLLGAGTAGGVAAYMTGESLLEQVEGTPVVEALIDAHEAAALFAVLISAGTLLLLSVYVAIRWRFGRGGGSDSLAIRIAVATAVIAAAFFVAWTAHIGGTMVWGVPR